MTAYRSTPFAIPDMNPEILAKVIRGETVESIYRGHLIVIDRGGVVASVGEPETVTFFRSSAKPFQAIPFITSGAADRFAFTEREIAMACASHSGEAIHVGLVEGMLAKTGLSESDLRCGVHSPFFEKENRRMLRAGEVPSQLHNNCSGKHTAMLAYAKHIDADLKNYESPGHPIQQAILKCVSDFTGVAAASIPVAVDGCAAPIFAVPVAAMARSFLDLIAPPETLDQNTRAACSRIVSAMVKFPELIGGSERLDTILMRAAPGRILSKVGADGVWLCAVLPCDEWPTGVAIALKVEDGDDMRGRPVIAADVLLQLGIVKSGDLNEISPMPIRNRRGDQVGQVVSRVRLGFDKG